MEVVLIAGMWLGLDRVLEVRELELLQLWVGLQVLVAVLPLCLHNLVIVLAKPVEAVASGLDLALVQGCKTAWVHHSSLFLLPLSSFYAFVCIDIKLKVRLL